MFGIGGKDKTAAADAHRILDAANREAIESAWDVYKHLKTVSEEYDHDYESTLELARATMDALEKTVEHNGDFKKIAKGNPLWLRALREGFLAYDDIMHVLIDHHDDAQEAKLLFEQHPKLHRAIPQQYDNAKKVIEVLCEMVREYRWNLEHFAMDHEKALSAAA